MGLVWHCNIRLNDYITFAEEPRSQHRVGIGLVELELAESVMRSLIHQKMLGGSGDVAEASLQGIAIKQRRASRRLESYRRYSLRHLGDISTGRPRFGLASRRRQPPSCRLFIQARHQLESEGTYRSELDLGLSKRKLKVRLRRQRGRRKAAALVDCLCGDLIQSVTRDAERYPDMEWRDGSRQTEPKGSAAGRRLPHDEVT